MNVTPGVRSSRLAGYAMVAVAASVWGTWKLFFAAAEARGPMPAAVEGVILFAAIILVTGPLALIERAPRRASRAAWIAVAVLGVADALNVILFFRAYQLTSVAVAVLTHYLAPIFVALAAPIFVGERASLRTAAAVAISFTGLVCLLQPWTDGASASLAGAAAGAGSAVFYAAAVLINKRLTGAYSASEVSFFHSLFALPILALAVPTDAWAQLDPGSVGIIVAGGIGPGALAGLLFLAGLRRIPASHASTLCLLEPMVAVALAATIHGEAIGAAAALGSLLILSGAALVVWYGPPPERAR